MLKTLEILSIYAVALLFLAGCEEKKVDTRSEFNITSTPDQAKITVNNNDGGLTPRQIRLQSGTYIMEVSKTNYKSSWQKLVATPSSRKNIEVELEPITSSVMINSNPAGAIVEINSVFAQCRNIASASEAYA